MKVGKRRPLLFRVALRRATWRAWREGKISATDAYMLNDVINGSKKGGRYYGKPEALIAAETEARQQMRVYDSEAAETGDIDWHHWIDLILTWLPLIIKAILLALMFLEPPKDEPSESSKIAPAE